LNATHITSTPMSLKQDVARSQAFPFYLKIVISGWRLIAQFPLMHVGGTDV